MQSRVVTTILALVLSAIIGWPVVATVAEACRGEAGATGGGLLDPASAATGGLSRPLDLMRNTLGLVTLTELVALPAGVAMAFILFRTDAWGRRPLMGLMALSAFVPMPLHATAWLGALGNAGRISRYGGGAVLVGLPGASFVHAMAAIPWVVLLAGVGLRTVEPELEEAALLEHPAWRVIFGVTLRRGLGAIFAAALAVAVLTASDMTVTDLLQVRTYAEEAYLQFQIGRGPGAAASVALPPLIVLGTLTSLGARWLFRVDSARLASAIHGGKTWLLGRWRVPLGALNVALAGTFTAFPIVCLIWRAGRVGGAAARGQSPQWSFVGLLGTLHSATAELGLSFPEASGDGAGSGFGAFDPLASPLLASALWGAIAATIAVILAWSIAWMGRGSRGWRVAAVVILAITLATPGPVAGMGLVFAYRGIAPIYDSAAILVLAGVFRTLPYAILVLWTAVLAIPKTLLETAAVDGCGPWGVVRRVAIPSTRPAILAAWCVAFVLALGELPATNLVAPPGTPPLAVIIWSLLHTGIGSYLAGVALVMLMAIAAAGLAAAWALARLGRASASEVG